MKDKNEQIKKIWRQKLNQGSPDTRLLSGIDFKKGRLNLEISESFGPSIQGHDNYKASNFF